MSNEGSRQLLVEKGEGQPLRLQHKHAVRVQALVKSFGPVHAVRKASFDVFAGEIFGLLGPNGAGKTTTLEIIEGLQKADDGAVQVLGYDSEHERHFIEPRIGIQLQSASLNPRLTALELLRMYAAFYPQPRDPAELLALFGLQEKENALASTLSGGQQQRLSVALALVGDPDLLLLDEPTTGLDPHARRELWVALQGLQARGKTILLTTHYLDEAQQVCDRVAIMDRGLVVAQGKPQDLITQNCPQATLEFHMASDDAVARLQALDGVQAVSASDGRAQIQTNDLGPTLAAIASSSEQLGLRLDTLTVRTSTLEDVFLQLTGRSFED